jgi:hypothetical protein
MNVSVQLLSDDLMEHEVHALSDLFYGDFIAYSVEIKNSAVAMECFQRFYCWI